MIRRFSVIIYIILIFLSGCQVKQQTTPSSPPSGLSATYQSPQTTKAAPPPVQLHALESGTEDILDDIGNEDWPAAKNKASIINNNVKELLPIIKAAKVPQEAVDGIVSAASELDSAVKSNKQFDATIQSIMVMRFIPDIADYYEAAYPADVMRLNFTAHLIKLDIDHRDWPAASGDLETADGIWVRLKTTLQSTYKLDVKTFQDTVDRLKSAVDTQDDAAASAEANQLLDGVDTVKKDFTEQNKK